MIKFIIEGVSDRELESGLIDGYGIIILYRVENTLSQDIIHEGVLKVKVKAKTCARTMGQNVNAEFRALWKRRLIYYLFTVLKEHIQHKGVPENDFTFWGDNYAWWESIPTDWAEMELILEE